MLKQYHVGLACMRIQPLHWGHIRLIDKMIQECRCPIIAIGSAQESRTYGNPFSHQERKRMLVGYYGAKCPLIIPIKDIFNIQQWARYVLDTVEHKIKNKVSVYYCGSIDNGIPFAKEGIHIEHVEMKSTYEGSGRNYILSATRVRNWILGGSDEWMPHVPTMNHALIKRVYKGAKI